MTRKTTAPRYRRAAQAGACGLSQSLASGLLLFLFAIVSFSLGHAQALPLGRAGQMGAEKPGQTLYTGSRDANRATPVIERKDQPQTAWTGDGWALPAVCALSMPGFSAALAVPPSQNPIVATACRDRLPRGPPLIS